MKQKHSDKSILQCEKCGRKYERLNHFKAPTCSLAETVSSKKVTKTETKTKHQEKDLDSHYFEDMDFMNIVNLSLINDYFQDDNSTAHLPTMVAITPEHNILTDNQVYILILHQIS